MLARFSEPGSTATLPGSDIDADGVAEVIAAMGSPHFPVALDHFVGAFAPFDLSVIFGYPYDCTPLLLHDGYRGQATQGAPQAYMAGGYLLDPFYTASVSRHPPGVWRMGQLSPGAFFESAFFGAADVHPCVSMEPGSLVEEVGFLIPLHSGFTATYSIMRRHGRPPFSEGDMRGLRRVQAIVREAVRTHWRDLERREPAEDPGMERAFATFCADRLTLQQRRIVKLILRGHGTLAIAEIIGVAEGTVKNHRKHIYRRLNISSQGELFALFMRHTRHT